MLGGTGLTQNHNISVSAGTDKTQTFISYNYNKQDGLLQNFSETRNSLRANVNSELYKGIRLDFSSMFTSNSTNGGGAYSGMKKIFFSLLQEELYLHKISYSIHRLLLITLH
jgi:hypothetical protein